MAARTVGYIVEFGLFYPLVIFLVLKMAKDWRKLMKEEK